MRLFVLLFSLFFMSNVAFASERGGEGEKVGVGPTYMEITPKFVVNLVEPRKYLAINVQLLVDGAPTEALIKKHMPAIKHELIMLFSDRSLDSLQTMEQREALRQAAIDTIHNTIDKSEGVDPEAEPEHHAPAPAHKKDTAKKSYNHMPSEGFKDAFFTEFLVQ